MAGLDYLANGVTLFWYFFYYYYFSSNCRIFIYQRSCHMSPYISGLAITSTGFQSEVLLMKFWSLRCRGNLWLVMGCGPTHVIFQMKFIVTFVCFNNVRSTRNITYRKTHGSSFWPSADVLKRISRAMILRVLQILLSLILHPLHHEQHLYSVCCIGMVVTAHIWQSLEHFHNRIICIMIVVNKKIASIVGLLCMHTTSH
jgi:hypothetical protein